MQKEDSVNKSEKETGARIPLHVWQTQRIEENSAAKIFLKGYLSIATR